MGITGRYAPSPTGTLHVGNLRTAVLAELRARQRGGVLRLRIDDLDPVTSSDEHLDRQLADLEAVGVTFDGEPVRQTDRFVRYRNAIEELDSAGLVYPCFCSRREIREAASAPHVHLPDGAYPGTCADLGSTERDRRAESRPAALRVRAGGEEVQFADRAAGETTGWIDDFVIRRNDGIPAYNLATVVDDADMGVTEVVRGADLLSTTPRQVWLLRRLGFPPVEWCHVPLMVNESGQRLAKRDGAVTRADLTSLGVSDAELRARLLASVGLAEGEPFDPATLGTDPTTWSLRGQTPT